MSDEKSSPDASIGGQQSSPATLLGANPGDLQRAVSQVVKMGGSATVHLTGKTLASAIAQLGDQLAQVSAVVTLRGTTPAK